MGYYSTFTVDVCNPKTVCLADEETIRTVIKQLREFCDDANSCLGDMGEPADIAKWYDFEEDLCNFTKDRTDIILVVYRIGNPRGNNGPSLHTPYRGKAPRIHFSQHIDTRK